MIAKIFKLLGLLPDTKEEKIKRISTIIDNDPQLIKIDEEIARLNNESGKLNPEFKEILKKYRAL